jgi:TPR repeat protein
MKPKTKRYILSGLIILIISVVAAGFYNNYDYRVNAPQRLYKQGQKKYIEKKFNLAFYDFKNAAEMGDADAQYAVGYLYGSGDGTEKNIFEAIEWYKKAANNGHMNSQVALGFIYLDDKNKDYKKAFEWFNKAADQGSITAQNIIAGMHYWGKGATKDYAQALHWYNKVVEHNQRKDNETHCDTDIRLAYFQIGLIYYLGNGIKKNIKKAEEIWQESLKNSPKCEDSESYANLIKQVPKAIEDNDPVALFDVGNFYSACCLTSPPPPARGDSFWDQLEFCSQEEIYSVSAVDYFKKAADLGCSPAQVKLAQYYKDLKDYKQALKWFERAANDGNAAAYKSLGDMYYEGLGIPKSYQDAFVWYAKAAMKDNLDAQSRLAIIYFSGEGTPKDVVKAYTWLNIVLPQYKAKDPETYNYKVQLPYYNDLFERVTREMTGEQIVAAQEYSKQLVKEIESRKEKQDIFEPPQKQVRVTNESNPKLIKSTGTGFIITPDGYVITNSHVIKNAASIKVVSEKGTHKAELVKEEVKNDLAILKISGSFAAAPIAREKSAKLGEKVFTIGFPNPTLQGFSPKITDGLISSIYGIQDDPRLYQTSVAVQPGNSGGPLLDKYGNVVGVVMLTLNAKETFNITGSIPQNVNYAIKSSYVLELLKSEQNLIKKIPDDNNKEAPFEDIVQRIQKSVVLILVY